MIRTLSAKQIAIRLELTEPWVRELARRGTIPGTQKGRTWLFNEEEVRLAHYSNNSYQKA